MNSALTMFFTFITWALIQRYLVKPLSKMAHSHLSPRVAEFLTKKRFGG